MAAPNPLLIDETLPVDGIPSGRRGDDALGRVLALYPLRRLERIIVTLLNAHGRDVIEVCMANEEILRLPARGYDAIELGMTEMRRNALVAAGRRAMAEYPDRRGSRMPVGSP